MVEMLKEKCLEKEKNKKLIESMMESRNTVLREYFKDDLAEEMSSDKTAFKRGNRKSA